MPSMSDRKWKQAIDGMMYYAQHPDELEKIRRGELVLKRDQSTSELLVRESSLEGIARNTGAEVNDSGRYNSGSGGYQASMQGVTPANPGWSSNFPIKESGKGWKY